ncbi:sulfotransferase [uncultured Desulfobacter sp.]|uniref:sulfotransferase n=1 Tax=uncultured Desulfobacter sp. TaxID=240139 RepID=UPI0029F4969D|nr:sulfotransferase [uncultured Desulfobacter sp.]
MVKTDNVNGLPSEPLFLYGSGRSGTTWLEERIAGALDAEVIFEPLQERLHGTAKAYGFRYLDASENHPELQIYFQKLIMGDLKYFWTRYRILPDRLLPTIQTFSNKGEFKAWIKRFPDAFRLMVRYHSTINRPRKIIKLIRANLMIAWLNKTFPSSLHIAIVRHPAAVIESRMRLDRVAQNISIVKGASDWNAKNLLNKYLQYQLPKELKKIIKDIGSMDKLSLYEHHCLLWCIENKLLFNYKNIVSQLIYYEDVIDKENQTWRDLADIINVDENQLTHGMEKPSQQSSKLNQRLQLKFYNSSSPIEKLKCIHGSSCIHILQDYLDLFSIKHYRADSLFPIHHCEK